MNKYEARSVMILSAFGLSIGTFMFISSKKYSVLVIGRGFIGAAQAILGTYYPVWINEFAPKKS